MWLKAFTILPILIGHGINATPQQENTKNLDKAPIKSAVSIQDFSLEMQWITKYEQTSYDPETTKNIHSVKNENQAFNTALLVKEWQYTQEMIADVQNGTEYIYIPNENGTQGYTTALLCYQITPYENLVNVEEDLKLTLALRLALGLQDRDVNLNIHVINSIDNYWLNYMDLTNYYQPKILQSTYNYLTSSENSFTFQEQHYTETLLIATQNGGMDSQVATIDLNLVNNQTNYVVIYIEPKIQTTGSTGETPELIYGQILMPDSNTYIKQWLFFTDLNGLHNNVIRGQMVVGANSYEVIDLPNVMLYVLTMPFTFISVAFNLTLWEGTPYQINISNLFLSVIAICTFIWIITFLIKLRNR